MEVSITPQMDQWISEKVNSGLYRCSDEVILEGLRLLMRQEQQRLAMTEDLRQEILVGLRQLDAGKSAVFDSSLSDKIKEGGRNRLGA
ncbi:MAG: type II toxin-antitoxin system ParD family antitoxin [Deltaproteobacteria bacterium]|jgi:antitoxin ParD1/3/4|nr:type II toxin-antitoxin system ParD family antitoxin [Deltaproteobacteria bacterium]